MKMCVHSHCTFTENLLLADGGIPLLKSGQNYKQNTSEAEWVVPCDTEIVAHIEPRYLLHLQLSSLHNVHLPIIIVFVNISNTLKSQLSKSNFQRGRNKV